MARGRKTGGRKAGTPNKTGRDIRELARQYGPLAIDALVIALADPRSRVQAASILLDRGFGKPAQPVTGQDGEGPAKIEIAWLPGES